ncbi:hypothetical protein [Parenemella sanctibonifatiensis]|nr:hypothetical protein [Parenemella sanctibonifatiensis]
MDITQLLITVGSVFGIVIICALAIVPSIPSVPMSESRRWPVEIDEPTTGTASSTTAAKAAETRERDLAA